MMQMPRVQSLARPLSTAVEQRSVGFGYPRRSVELHVTTGGLILVDFRGPDYLLLPGENEDWQNTRVNCASFEHWAEAQKAILDWLTISWGKESEPAPISCA